MFDWSSVLAQMNVTVLHSDRQQIRIESEDEVEVGFYFNFVPQQLRPSTFPQHFVPHDNEVLVTPYLSKSLRARCDGDRIGYLTKSHGSLWFRDNHYTYVNPSYVRDDSRVAFTETQSRIIHSLLLQPTATQQQVADIAQVKQPYVTRMVHDMMEKELWHPQPTLEHVRSLATYWLENRSWNYLTTYWWDDTNNIRDRYLTYRDYSPTPFVVSGEIAQDIYSAVTPSETLIAIHDVHPNHENSPLTPVTDIADADIIVHTPINNQQIITNSTATMWSIDAIQVADIFQTMHDIHTYSTLKPDQAIDGLMNRLEQYVHLPNH